MTEPISQRDNKWASILLGTSKTSTIGMYGCTITSLAYILGTTPEIFNAKLKAVDGYQVDLILWSKIKEAYPEVINVYRHYTYNNDVALKNIPCLVEFSGARLNNPKGKHWVVAIGDGKIMDPWTGVVKSFGYYGEPTGMTTISLASDFKDAPESDLADEKRLHNITRDQVRAADTFVEGLIIKLAPDPIKYKGIEKTEIIKLEVDKLLENEDFKVKYKSEVKARQDDHDKNKLKLEKLEGKVKTLEQKIVDIQKEAGSLGTEVSETIKEAKVSGEKVEEDNSITETSWWQSLEISLGRVWRSLWE